MHLKNRTQCYKALFKIMTQISRRKRYQVLNLKKLVLQPQKVTKLQIVEQAFNLNIFPFLTCPTPSRMCKQPCGKGVQSIALLVTPIFHHN